jgi:acetyl-CoA C-acetyltransferase
VPLTSVKQLFDKEGNLTGTEAVTLARRRQPRRHHAREPGGAQARVEERQWVPEGRFITAGNASQLSDGASASVLMSRSEARGAACAAGHLSRHGVAGCAPDEMGIGPVFADPQAAAATGLTVEDIGLWELNEAFACQVLYCRDRLGIPDDRLNVNGGAIAIGHPFGMSGARLVGHALLEGAAAA